MSISKKLSLSLLSVTLITGNAIGMQGTPEEDTTQPKTVILPTQVDVVNDLKKTNDTLRKELQKREGLLTDYRKELRQSMTAHAKEVEAQKTINQIFYYFKNHMNRGALHQVTVHAAVEASAWAIRRELENSSLTDEQVAFAERFIDAIQKASRAHLAATAITGAMNKSKTTKYGKKILQESKEYHANAYASLIMTVGAQLLVDRYGNDNLACKAAPYIAGTVAGVAVGTFAPHKAFIN